MLGTAPVLGNSTIVDRDREFDQTAKTDTRETAACTECERLHTYNAALLRDNRILLERIEGFERLCNTLAAQIDKARDHRTPTLIVTKPVETPPVETHADGVRDVKECFSLAPASQGFCVLPSGHDGPCMTGAAA